jgi:hypothetical protein
MQSAIIYKGPSMIDGAPIVVIATGLGKASGNTKTGALVQTWIIREDISPTDAIHTGADGSICGACPHRGVIIDGKNTGRSCYVTVFQAPLSVFKAYKAGRYAELDTGQARIALAGKRVRLGAYGDPAAVPFHVWQSILPDVDAMTGYTHQWRLVSTPPEFAQFVMASCDTDQDRSDAKAMGYRTFRVRVASDALGPREVICPASQEAGYKTTCAACVACGGHGSKAKADIAIIAHGSRATVNAFNARVAA